MRSLIEITTDISLVKRELVRASAKRDGAAYIAAGHCLNDLYSELTYRTRKAVEAFEISNRKAAKIRKTVSKAVFHNVATFRNLPATPKLKTSLESFTKGPHGNLGVCSPKGAKPSSSYSGSRRRNRLERSPIQGSGPADSHASPAGARLRDAAKLPMLAPLSEADERRLALR